MEKLKIAVLGDSAMWGQGLKTEDKYYVLASNRIAQVVGRVAVIDDNVNTARSGAKIIAAKHSDVGKKFVIDPDIANFFNIKVVKVADHRGIDVTLPSGNHLRVPRGDRANFYDTYPTFFQTDDQVISFFDGQNEEPGLQLFGEIPSTFPTINYQVDRIDQSLGERINVVFLNGSVNDVDFEQVLDSLDGPEIEKIDVLIREFAYVKLTELLSKARDKFPNAVILLTGYFSPFSQSSDRGKLKRLAEYISGKPEWLVSANNYYTSIWGKYTPLGILFNTFGATKDVGKFVNESIQRSEFAHSRGLYWLRRAVSELYENGKAGPGLYFVNPAFKPENSLFASAPFLFQGYKPPDEEGSHLVQDQALEERLNRTPRIKLLSELEETGKLLLSKVFPLEQLTNSNKQNIAELLGKLDGPASLIKKLKEIKDKPSDSSLLISAIGDLNEEIGRIRLAKIASFVHPNKAGAQRYADQIVARYNRHLLLSVKSDLHQLAAIETLPPPKVISLKGVLFRYGINPNIGLRAAMQHMIVDSIAVEMRMKAPSFPDVFNGLENFAKVFINVGDGRRWRLNNPFGKLNTIDTFGELHLGEIKQLVLEVDEGLKFKLEDFTFSINGKAVFHFSGNVFLNRGDKLDFNYPPQRLVILPNQINFHAVPKGETRVLDLKLENPTGREVDISILGPPSNSVFQWEAFKGVISSGEEKSFQVRFHRRSIAPQGATLIITSNALGSPHSVGIFGKGPGGFEVPDPDDEPELPQKLDLSPKVLTFGSSSIGVLKVLTLTIKNPTGRDVNISVPASPLGSVFTWEAFSGVLKDREKISIQVAFLPRSNAVETGQIIVRSNTLGSPHSIGIGGKGPGGFSTS